jgi:hypothetical protein
VLVRDVAIFVARGNLLEGLRAFDLIPRTEVVERVALMEGSG